MTMLALASLLAASDEIKNCICVGFINILTHFVTQQCVKLSLHSHIPFLFLNNVMIRYVSTSIGHHYLYRSLYNVCVGTVLTHQ